MTMSSYSLTGAQKPSGLWMEICTFIHFTFHFPLAGYHDEFCPGAFRQSHRKRRSLDYSDLVEQDYLYSLSHKRSFGLESWPPCLMLQVYYRLGSLLKRLNGEADEERQKAGPTLFTWKIGRQPSGVPGVGTSRGAESQGTVSGISDELKRSENQFWCGWLTMVDAWISESI